MTPQSANPNFDNLLKANDGKVLLQELKELENKLSRANHPIQTDSDKCFKHSDKKWQQLQSTNPFSENADKNIDIDIDEKLTTDWLIQLFNTLFAMQRVKLVRADGEPQYFPTSNNNPARIEFANGFFASALHEISHWCIAGERRRQLIDFGYWYAPDGRTATQQQAFESLEIKPQALECLFTLACKRPFQVSQDNLFADFDTSSSTFAHDVYKQAYQYISSPKSLPRDAKTLLRELLTFNSNA